MRKLMASMFVVFMVCVLVFAQTVTTPNLGLTLPPKGTPNYDVILNNNFSIIDTAVGVLQSAYTGLWSSIFVYSKGQQVTYNGALYVSAINSNSGNIPSLSPTSWTLMIASGGTVTSVGDFPPLFTVSNRTTVPTFNAISVAQNAILAGPISGGSGPYSFRLLIANDMPSSIFSNTSGNAATATAFATVPTKCSPGNYPLGVDSQGNAQNCASVTGGGTVLPATKTAVTNQWFNSYDATTGLFTSTQPLFSNISGVSTKAQSPATVVYTDQANNYTSGMKQTFAANATNAGVNYAGVTSDPSSLVDGDRWYRSDLSRPRVRAGATTQSLAFLSDLPSVAPSNTPAVAHQFFTAYNSVTGTFTKAQPDITDLTGAGSSAGNYLRSNGSTWALSGIQVSDVPQLNQSTTSIATGNMMNLALGPYAGTVPGTAASSFGRTTLPAQITIVSFTANFQTAPVGCTSFAAWQVYDFNTSTGLSTITEVNGTTQYTNPGLSIVVPTAHDIGIRVSVSAGGCTTSPAGGTFVIWYTM